MQGYTIIVDCSFRGGGAEGELDTDVVYWHVYKLYSIHVRSLHHNVW